MTARSSSRHSTLQSGRFCQGCGAGLPEPKKPGPPRKWCSERCRKSQYAGQCVDCGRLTNGYDGPGKASERCVPCAQAKQTAEAIWPRERVLQDARRWRDMTGRWPTSGDWNPYAVTNNQALLKEVHRVTGPWPHLETIDRLFGSWPKFLVALGAPSEHAGRGLSSGVREREYREILERAEVRDAA